MRHHHFQKTWKPFLRPGDESLNCNSKPWVLTCQKRPQRNEPCRPLCCRELSPLPVLSTAWSGGSIKSTRQPNSDLCAEQELHYWLLRTLCLPGLLSVTAVRTGSGLHCSSLQLLDFYWTEGIRASWGKGNLSVCGNREWKRKKLYDKRALKLPASI